MRRSWLAMALVLTATACGGSPATPDGAPGDGAPDDGAPGDGAATDGVPSGDGPAPRRLPPHNAGLDYQLGGAYPPPAAAGIVARDREALPAPGRYNVCYVNGFQAQPGDDAMWAAMDLILEDASGQPVIDPDWNEALLDVRTPTKRAAIAAIVGGWIAGCKTAGFDAVEIDNLDSYSRSNGLITQNDAVATMALFSASAHGQGMAIAQKNSSEIVGRKAEMGTDFAVSEECNRFSECDVYVGAYGDHVLVIEYRRQDFTAGCTQWGNRLSIVLRDVDLVPQGAAGYVFDGC